MNKFITIGIIFIIIAIMATAIFLNIEVNRETIGTEQETLEDLTSDHLDQALEELEQIDFYLLS